MIESPLIILKINKYRERTKAFSNISYTHCATGQSNVNEGKPLFIFIFLLNEKNDKVKLSPFDKLKGRKGTKHWVSVAANITKSLTHVLLMKEQFANYFLPKQIRRDYHPASGPRSR